jgi:1-phosphofructokinase family hexose kinase
VIVDHARGETVIDERGAPVDAGRVRALRRRFRRHLESAQVVILNGSLPPGIPDDLYASMIAEAAPRPTILDTSGAALRHGLESQPTVAKPNRRELEEVLGRPLASLEDVAAAAEDLHAQGTGWVVVSLGADGVVLASGEGTWHLRPPPVERVNAVGAGDSLVAGLASGLTRGYTSLEATRLAVAASASDVRTLLPGTVEPEAVRALLPQVSAEPL